MRALVTGGAGFIGSHVADLLVARGDEVTVIDDLSTGRRENVPDAATLIESSIVDAAAVAEAFERARPEVVLHLAAQMDVRKSIADPIFDLDINVAGTINVLERAREQPGCRVIFASTGGAIYGEGDGRDLPLDEAADCRPDAHYGQSKLSAEGYLALYSRLYGVETTALRLGNVYGPRQDPHGEAGVVAIFCGLLLDGTAPRGSSATARRRATTSTSPTSPARSSRPPRDHRAAPTTSEPASKRASSISAGSSPVPRASVSSPSSSPPARERSSGSRSLPTARRESSAGRRTSGSRTGSRARWNRSGFSPRRPVGPRCARMRAPLRFVRPSSDGYRTKT